jgi:hypothetical protein
VAPAINCCGPNEQFTGNSSIYSQYAGLMFFAYGTGNALAMSAGAQLSGAIFAPSGNAGVSAPGTGATCAGGGATACGFFEARTVTVSGPGAHWHGLGPGFNAPPETGVIHSTVTGANLSLNE